MSRHNRKNKRTRIQRSQRQVSANVSPAISRLISTLDECPEGALRIMGGLTMSLGGLSKSDRPQAEAILREWCQKKGVRLFISVPGDRMAPAMVADRAENNLRASYSEHGGSPTDDQIRQARQRAQDNSVEARCADAINEMETQQKNMKNISKMDTSMLLNALAEMLHGKASDQDPMGSVIAAITLAIVHHMATNPTSVTVEPLREMVPNLVVDFAQEFWTDVMDQAIGIDDPDEIASHRATALHNLLTQAFTAIARQLEADNGDHSTTDNGDR